MPHEGPGARGDRRGDPPSSSAREAHRREHGDRARLDRRLPAGARALRELADGSALRPLRRREPARLRRDRAGGVLRAAANGDRAADDVAADAGRLPRDVRGARGIRAHLLAAALREALRHVRERAHGGCASSAATRCASSTPRPRRRRSRCSASRSSGGSSAGRATRRSTSSSRASSGDASLIFTVDTLEFLQKGGRIGKAAAFAGNLLHIKPILTIEDGEVLPLKRVRGNQKAVQEFARAFTESTRDTPNLHVGIAHADAPEREQALRALVADLRPQAQIDVATTLGAVVGTHAGPGTVGFFWFETIPSERDARRHDRARRWRARVAARVRSLRRDGSQAERADAAGRSTSSRGRTCDRRRCTSSPARTTRRRATSSSRRRRRSTRPGR